MNEEPRKAKVIYLCDGAAEGCSRRGCAIASKWFGDCRHTTNEKNAVNGICREPWKYPERFIEIVPGEWWEIAPLFEPERF